MGEVLEELPLRYAGFSTNFRREAGAAGKDTRGMFRVHQFNKVEMFVFVPPEESWDEHERLLELEERFIQALGLPYRVVNIGRRRPRRLGREQVRHRGVVPVRRSATARSRRARTRPTTRPAASASATAPSSGLEPPHTLNGTMVTDRALLAILENFQGEVPEVLQQLRRAVRGLPASLGHNARRRGAGAVERGGLENRWARKRLVGSNPTPAADLPCKTRPS